MTNRQECKMIHEAFRQAFDAAGLLDDFSRKWGGSRMFYKNDKSTRNRRRIFKIRTRFPSEDERNVIREVQKQFQHMGWELWANGKGIKKYDPLKFHELSEGLQQKSSLRFL